MGTRPRIDKKSRPRNEGQDESDRLFFCSFARPLATWAEGRLRLLAALQPGMSTLPSQPYDVSEGDAVSKSLGLAGASGYETWGGTASRAVLSASLGNAEK